MKSTFSISAVAAIAITAAYGQSSLGSIQGIVVGSDGTPLPGARVYAGLKAANQTSPAPPTLMSSVVNAAVAHSNGKLVSPSATNGFVIPKLSAGTYVICAQTTIAGWLDPCHWSASIPVVTVAPGQNITGQTVVMTKGAVLQVRINDPSKLLPATLGPSLAANQSFTPIPQDIEVIGLASNHAFYHARIVSIDAAGRTEQLTLPFDAPHTLIVRSRQFTLTDTRGAALPAAGQTQPLQISTGAALSQFSYTVSGRAH